MEDNTTNFHQVEGSMDNQPDSTVTTTQEPKGKTTKFSKHPEKKMNQTELKLKYLSEKVQQIVQYLVEEEQQQANYRIKDTACILEILDTVYKDCPKVREDSIPKGEGKNFIPVMGLYHKEVTKNEMIKIIPLEEGWKMLNFTPNDPEKPTEYTANYEYIGILPNADYPTTWSITGDQPHSFTMKLRDYLLSLNEEKTIIM
jgi:hypothetical protein